MLPSRSRSDLLSICPLVPRFPTLHLEGHPASPRASMHQPHSRYALGVWDVELSIPSQGLRLQPALGDGARYKTTARANKPMCRRHLEADIGNWIGKISLNGLGGLVLRLLTLRPEQGRCCNLLISSRVITLKPARTSRWSGSRLRPPPDATCLVSELARSRSLFCDGIQRPLPLNSILTRGPKPCSSLTIDRHRRLGLTTKGTVHRKLR